MQLREPESWQRGQGPDLDTWLAALPNVPAVFLVHTAPAEPTARPTEPAEPPAEPTLFDATPAAKPYLGRTSLIRRRLLRLLGPRTHPSRLLNLRDLAQRIDIWKTASTIETALTSYTLARRHYPDTYARLLRLPKPPYLKLILTNQFPRTMVTTRLGGRSRYFGPFRNRAAADAFEKAFLDLFQIRRCQEDLEPSPDHPGCIYGEMRMCLRPCQDAVSIEEYASETTRVDEFLRTNGHSLLEATRVSRDRLSESLHFEEAARAHAMLEKIQGITRLSGELAADVDQLHGIAITRSVNYEEVSLWFLLRGCWQPERAFALNANIDGRPVPMDARLREIAASLPATLTLRDRQDHLALLTRWFFSNWRDGEWLPFDSLDSIPYRKLTNAIHRVAAGKADTPAQGILPIR